MSDSTIKQFWADDRKYLARLWPALLVCAAVAVTWLLFGPLDLTSQNESFMTFSVFDILWPCLFATLAFTAVAGLSLALFRGKIYDLFLSLAAGFLLASYLQGTFLNIPLGRLDGNWIPWHNQAVHAVLNLALWFVLITLPHMLHALNKKAWKFAILFVSALTIGMQLSSLIVTLTKPNLGVIHRDQFLSTAGEFEVSTKDNIIVFLLDRLDTGYIDEVEEKSPGFFDALEGFTYYPNNVSSYCRTFPSVTHMLTNKLFFFDTPASDYFAQAWSQADFLPKLRQAGYTTKVYTSEGFVYSDILQLVGQVDNITAGMISPKMDKVLEHIAKLTAFRYAPHALKASFWLSTSDFEGLRHVQSGPTPYLVDDYAFYQSLTESGLTTQSEANNFVFYHLNGCHSPITLTEDIQVVETSTTLGQTKGVFNIVRSYLDRLKALGLYENATIIITGDHAVSDDYDRLFRTKTTGLFLKPKGSFGTPLVVSDAPQAAAYFQPTILAAAGLEAPGLTYADILPDSPTPRKYYYRVDLLDENRSVLEEYDVVGDAALFENWRKVGEHEMRYPY